MQPPGAVSWFICYFALHFQVKVKTEFHHEHGFAFYEIVRENRI
jgi:hypothetical protein